MAKPQKHFPLLRPIFYTRCFVVFCLCLLGYLYTSRPALAENDILVGILSFKVPIQWNVLKGNDEASARHQVEESMKDMLNHYGVSKEQFGIKEFTAIKITHEGGWVVAYRLTFPPQDDYYRTIENEEKEKIRWGKEQGIVLRVIESGKITINNRDIIKTHLVMRNGSHAITLTYWAAESPGESSIISIILHSAQYDKNVGPVERLISSIAFSPRN